MTEPIWSLISKMSVVPGSTGMHRYNLINQALIHFDEWAILGSRNTSHWGRGLNDLTNVYIGEGVRGGLITLIILLVMLYTALKTLFRLSMEQRGHKQRFLVWCIFVAIAGNCIAFFGVSYFGQMTMLLYLMFSWFSCIYGNERNTKYKILHKNAVVSNKHNIRVTV